MPNLLGLAKTGGGLTSSQYPNMPADIVVGEVLIMHVAVSRFVHPPITITQHPTGWTNLTQQVGWYGRHLVYWRVADGTEYDDYDASYIEASGSSRWMIVVSRWDDINAAGGSPFLQSSVSADDVASGLMTERHSPPLASAPDAPNALMSFMGTVVNSGNSNEFPHEHYGPDEGARRLTSAYQAGAYEEGDVPAARVHELATYDGPNWGDYWSLELTTGGTVLIETQSGLDHDEYQDSYMTVYDKDFNIVGVNDDRDPDTDDYMSALSLTLAAGQYYVEVAGWGADDVGPFTIRATPSAGAVLGAAASMPDSAVAYRQGVYGPDFNMVGCSVDDAGDSATTARRWRINPPRHIMVATFEVLPVDVTPRINVGDVPLTADVGDVWLAPALIFTNIDPDGVGESGELGDVTLESASPSSPEVAAPRNTLTDPRDGHVYAWDINHSEEAELRLGRALDHTAPGSSVHVVRQQRPDGDLVLHLSGTILDPDQYAALTDFFERSRDTLLIFHDASGDEYTVLIVSQDAPRKRTPANPRNVALTHYWTYTIEMEVVGVREGPLREVSP